MASQPVACDPSRGYQKSNTFWRKLGELGSDQELGLFGLSWESTWDSFFRDFMDLETVFSFYEC